MRKCRHRAEAVERGDSDDSDDDNNENADRQKGEKRKKGGAVDELRGLLEACVKNNFVGVENPRLYSQTYYGTKNLVQNFTDEGQLSLAVSRRDFPCV
ncbi:triacylglycerol lipase [Verticillium alfalfae VaMs.102]|uniref:Triacylglycerol lipase n=1 Tax=Verticillium alfalfae (strain VaMs.102 / ATCC MYA-4576 / FGSC 10136) TaxID=526221 RepID=C9SED8_VERA1|nr:triacylglycerol lipase [Verticillium alfalfae VaMs.102]EEY16531.1 triacylglycerol lipase [Verticillium alfalfae VaMs.102]